MRFASMWLSNEDDSVHTEMHDEPSDKQHKILTEIFYML
jgi:hypothetical protein